jgi:sirohydrochlorin cobaltochelatase
MKQGLLLFAHGARDPRWAQPFEAVAERVRARAPQIPVALCFLEFMAPDLLEGGRLLAEAGCGRVDLVPLFLGAGGHVRKDVPELLGRVQAAHPAIRWDLRPAIGEVDIVIDAMASASLAWLRQG